MAYSATKPAVTDPNEEDMHPDAIALRAAGMFALGPNMTSAPATAPSAGQGYLGPAATQPKPGTYVAPQTSMAFGPARPPAPTATPLAAAAPAIAATAAAPAAPPHPDQMLMGSYGPPRPAAALRTDLQAERSRLGLEDQGNIATMQRLQSALNHPGAAIGTVAQYGGVEGVKSHLGQLTGQRAAAGQEQALIAAATRNNEPHLVGSDTEARASGANLFQSGASNADAEIARLHADATMDPVRKVQLLNDAYSIRDHFARLADARRSGADGVTAASVNAGRSAISEGAQGQSDQAARLAYAAEEKAAYARTAGASIDRANISRAVSDAEGAASRSRIQNSPETLSAMNDAQVAGAQAQAGQARGQLALTLADTNQMLKKANDVNASVATEDEKAAKIVDLISPALVKLKTSAMIEPSDEPTVAALSDGVNQLATRFESLPPQAQQYYRDRLLAALGNPKPSDLSVGGGWTRGWHNALSYVSLSSDHAAITRAIDNGNAIMAKLRGVLFPAGSQ